MTPASVVIAGIAAVRFGYWLCVIAALWIFVGNLLLSPLPHRIEMSVARIMAQQ